MTNAIAVSVRGVASGCFLFLLSLSAPVDAGPTIGAQLGVTSIKAGEAGQAIRVSALNDGPALRADVYLAIEAPGGAFYSFTGRGGWRSGIVPWLRSLEVPAGFSFPSTLVSRLPGLTTPGTYRVHAAFAKPGTLDLLHQKKVSFKVSGDGGDDGARYGAVILSEFQAVIDDGGGRRVTTQVSATGSFFESNRSFEDTRDLLEGVAPRLDQCVFNERELDSSMPGGLSVRTLDVGERIRLSGTQRGRRVGAVDLPRDGDAAALGDFFYGLPDSTVLPAGVLSSQYRYTFSASGGSGLGGFTAAVDGVDPLRLTTPSPTGLTAINSSRNMALAWRGNRGVGEVDVSLNGTSLSKICSVTCRFVDDGQASIPTGVLRQLKGCIGDGGFPDLPDLPDLPDGLPIPDFGSVVSFSISRGREQSFNTSRRELSSGLAIVQAGVLVNGVELK